MPDLIPDVKIADFVPTQALTNVYDQAAKGTKNLSDMAAKAVPGGQMAQGLVNNGLDSMVNIGEMTN